MTKAKKIISSLAAIALIVMAGCEWSSPSSEDTWTMNGYDWFDFSGTFRGVDGSPIVSGFTYENPTEQGIVNNEVVASLSSAQSNFGGSFNHNSVIPSSVTIFAGNYTFVDNGLGSLSTSSGGSGGDIETVVTREQVAPAPSSPTSLFTGSFNHNNVKPGSVTVFAGDYVFTEYFPTSADYTRAVEEGMATLRTSDGDLGTISYQTGAWSVNTPASSTSAVYANYVYITVTSESTASGTISYGTGAWSINLGGSTVSGNVTASYAYTLDQPFEPGNTGTPIVTLSIAQVGNKLTIYDSMGRTFNGTIGVANGSGGTTAPTADNDYSSQVMAQFTAYHGDIEIVGTLTGLYGSDEPGVLFDRTIQAVWIEPTVQGDVNGTTGSLYVPEFVDAIIPTTDTTTTP